MLEKFSNYFKNLYRENLDKKDLEKVKKMVAEFYKIPEKVLDKVKIYYNKLPEIYKVFIVKIKNLYTMLYVPVGKVLGMYLPDKKEIYLDEKLSYFGKVKTLFHEYTHAAQDYLGKLYRNSLEKIEEEARKVSDYLFRIYILNSRRPSSS
ncbi:MAG: hypothetical protein RMJ18_01900 [Candidatus Aenigmarchaeota archaeon]|nr:hypothetical protein [Candidatus Aenigmarchaeota archaeon]MCX8190605.1 hypothetical protein [Candidatus Aenigmarchaeota archaeon]MDW8160148.1 hypothetical protein [Candidatus Aenigmarchaeota archaeon]